MKALAQASALTLSVLGLAACGNPASKSEAAAPTEGSLTARYEPLKNEYFRMLTAPVDATVAAQVPAFEAQLSALALEVQQRAAAGTISGEESWVAYNVTLRAGHLRAQTGQWGLRQEAGLAMTKDQARVRMETALPFLETSVKLLPGSFNQSVLRARKAELAELITGKLPAAEVDGQLTAAVHDQNAMQIAIISLQHLPVEAPESQRLYGALLANAKTHETGENPGCDALARRTSLASTVQRADAWMRAGEFLQLAGENEGAGQSLGAAQQILNYVKGCTDVPTVAAWPLLSTIDTRIERLDALQKGERPAVDFYASKEYDRTYACASCHVSTPMGQ